MTPQELQAKLVHANISECCLEFEDECNPARLTAVTLYVWQADESVQKVRIVADYDGYREEAPYLHIEEA